VYLHIRKQVVQTTPSCSFSPDLAQSDFKTRKIMQIIWRWEFYMHGKWMAERPNNNTFSTTESMLWRNSRTSAYQLQKTMLKS